MSGLSLLKISALWRLKSEKEMKEKKKGDIFCPGFFSPKSLPQSPLKPRLGDLGGPFFSRVTLTKISQNHWANDKK